MIRLVHFLIETFEKFPSVGLVRFDRDFEKLLRVRLVHFLIEIFLRNFLIEGFV